MGELAVCTFNSKGWPRRRLRAVNLDDYAVFKALEPDILCEQERWWPGQLQGFRRIWSPDRGYSRSLPRSVPGSDGCGVAHRWKILHTLTKYRWTLHGPVWGVCGRRSITGIVASVVADGRTLTYGSAHLTPSAWSNRFPPGSRRKRRAQEAWRLGMLRVRNFAGNQLKAGRAVVIIGIDANANADRVRAALGRTINGHPVHIYTSPHGHRIDHIIVVGRCELVGTTPAPHVTSDHAPFTVSVRI